MNYIFRLFIVANIMCAGMHSTHASTTPHQKLYTTIRTPKTTALSWSKKILQVGGLMGVAGYGIYALTKLYTNTAHEMIGYKSLKATGTFIQQNAPSIISAGAAFIAGCLLYARIDQLVAPTDPNNEPQPFTPGDRPGLMR